LVHTEPDHDEQGLPSWPEEVQKEEVQKEDGQKEKNVSPQLEDAMQLDGTPVEEELPPPGDPTFDTFFLVVWPHYNPYR
jgi:hypothetical protein